MADASILRKNPIGSEVEDSSAQAVRLGELTDTTSSIDTPGDNAYGLKSSDTAGDVCERNHHHIADHRHCGRAVCIKQAAGGRRSHGRRPFALGHRHPVAAGCACRLWRSGGDVHRDALRGFGGTGKDRRHRMGGPAPDREGGRGQPHTPPRPHDVAGCAADRHHQSQRRHCGPPAGGGRHRGEAEAPRLAAAHAAGVCGACGFTARAHRFAGQRAGIGSRTGFRFRRLQLLRVRPRRHSAGRRQHGHHRAVRRKAPALPQWRIHACGFQPPCPDPGGAIWPVERRVPPAGQGIVTPGGQGTRRCCRYEDAAWSRVRRRAGRQDGDAAQARHDCRRRLSDPQGRLRMPPRGCPPTFIWRSARKPIPAKVGIRCSIEAQDWPKW